MKKKLFLTLSVIAALFLTTQTFAQKANTLTKEEKKKVGYYYLMAKTSMVGVNVTEQQCQQTGKLKMVQ